MADAADIASSIPDLVKRGDVAGLVGEDLKLAAKQKAGMDKLVADRVTELQGERSEVKDIVGGAPKPPDLKPYTPPAPTDPWQLWGSPAMWMAGLSGFMGRRSATKSFQAAGAVIEATNKKDSAAAAEAFKAWKQETENAGKMYEYQRDAYDAALKGTEKDQALREAIFTTQAHARQDDIMRMAIEKEGLPGAEKIRQQREENYRQMKAQEIPLAKWHLEQQEKAEEDRLAEPAREATQALMANKDPLARTALADDANAKVAALREYVQASHGARDSVTSKGFQVFNGPNGPVKINMTTGDVTPIEIPSGGKAGSPLEVPVDPRQKTSDGVIPMDEPGTHRELTRIGQKTVLQIREEAQARAEGTVAGKVAAGGLGGRAEVFTNRMIGAAEQIAAASKTLMRLPEGASSGIFTSRDQGGGLMHAGMDTLQNKLTTQEVQSYKVLSAGTVRALAAIEAAGLAPPASLTRNMESVILHEGDTRLTKLQKMAEIRQITEAGMESILDNPRTPEQQKTEVRKILDKIKTNIPFTQSDILDLMYSDNPSMTLDAVAKKEKLGPMGPSPFEGYPDARQASDGDWYIQKDGKYFKVTQ